MYRLVVKRNGTRTKYSHQEINKSIRVCSLDYEFSFTVVVLIYKVFQEYAKEDTDTPDPGNLKSNS